METFTQRLQDAMAARNLGVSALDHALQKSDGYISNLISRAGTPRDHNLRAIAAVLAVNPTWLLQGTGERDDAALLPLEPRERFAKYKQSQPGAPTSEPWFRAPSKQEIESNFIRTSPKSAEKIKEACSDLVWETAQKHAELKFNSTESKVAVDLLTMFWADLSTDDEVLEIAAFRLLLAARTASKNGNKVNRASTLRAFFTDANDLSGHIYLQAIVRDNYLIISPTDRPNISHHGHSKHQANVVQRMADELNEKLVAIRYDENKEAAVMALMNIAKRFHATLGARYEAGATPDEFLISEIREPEE